MTPHVPHARRRPPDHRSEGCRRARSVRPLGRRGDRAHRRASCQSFSVAGSRKGHKALDDVLRLATRLADHEDEVSFDVAWKEVEAETDAMSDDRTGFVLQPLRWIMEAKLKRRRPYEVIVLEQVPTVLPVWKHFVDILRRTGYAAEAHVLHTEDFGVPQTRRRAVLIAQFDPGNVHRKVRFPKATHQRYRKGAERLPSTHDRGTDHCSTPRTPARTSSPGCPWATHFAPRARRNS